MKTILITKSAIREFVTNTRSLLYKRFLAKLVEVTTISFNIELVDLR